MEIFNNVYSIFNLCFMLDYRPELIKLEIFYLNGLEILFMKN